MSPRRAAVLMLCAASLGCGGGSPPSPFVRPDAGHDAGSDARDDAPGDAPPEDAGTDADPTLGGACLDDGQCDDALDCTMDRCDLSLERCRFTPDDSVCADTVWCDGTELCDPKLGCREGEPVSCSDQVTCTIDGCVEATRSCLHEPRDADGDGDPVWNCPGGSDCDDSDPRVSSHAEEICANGRDDDCDGELDETPGCSAPEHDTCVDPLVIETSGSYTLELAAASSDYAATCAGSGGQWRDVVVALVVSPGPPIDIDVVATAAFPEIALSAVGQCGDAATELACAKGVPPPTSGTLARMRLRALGPGNYPVYVFSTSAARVTLKVDYQQPSSKPTNETCASAELLTPGTHVSVPIVDATTDLSSACSATTGELVYRFDLASSRDVNVYVSSLDGFGLPVVSLRGPVCSTLGAELTCQVGQAPHLFARALATGSYYVAVAASAPSDLDLLVETGPPSVPPADESCALAPLLPHDTTIDVPLAAHTDDVQLGCLVGATDAAYELVLGERSDVLLVERISSGDTGAVSLALPSCAGSADSLACATGTRSPVRAAAHDVAPGSYRAVVESAQASPTELTALVRRSAPATLVAFADVCASAVVVPESGGFFQGNTANAVADYEAGCDVGGGVSGGAPDQMLSLELSATRRVILDMQGSAYNTLLDVRRGPACPGTEIVNGCAAGYVEGKSYLDLILPKGQYFIQIDGYSAAEGAWFLDVFVVEP